MYFSVLDTLSIINIIKIIPKDYPYSPPHPEVLVTHCLNICCTDVNFLIIKIIQYLKVATFLSHFDCYQGVKIKVKIRQQVT